MMEFIANLGITLELGDNAPQLANASLEPIYHMNYKILEVYYKCIQLCDSGYSSPLRDNWEAENFHHQYPTSKTRTKRTIEYNHIKRADSRDSGSFEILRKM